ALRQLRRHVPLAGEQLVRQRAPRAILLDEMRAREDEAMVERGELPLDLLLREAGELAELRCRQRTVRADGCGDRALLRRCAVRGHEDGHEPRRDARDRTREVASD